MTLAALDPRRRLALHPAREDPWHWSKGLARHLELALAVLLLGLAMFLRAPALLYSVADFDESLYLLFGDDLARGILPYTHLCDRTDYWSAWAMANIGAQRGFVDNPGQAIAWLPALRAMLEQVPLWVGTLLAGLFAPHPLRGGAERSRTGLGHDGMARADACSSASSRTE